MHTYPERACLDGLVAELFKLVSYGAAWEQWNEWLRVPLEHATARGNFELVNKLLDAGADGSAGEKGSRGRTLLDAAALGGNVDVVSALIKAGSKPDVNALSPSRGMRSALYTATVCGHEEAGRCLIFAGADVFFWDPVDQRNVISEAARGGHALLVHDMLIAGAHHEEHFYENPLHLAVLAGSESIVDMLLMKGADPDIVDNDGETPLIYASDLGHTSIVKKLLAAEADADICAHDGRSALHAAATCGKHEIVSKLLDEGLDLDACDESDETPLISAAKAGKTSAAQTLLAAGADIKIRDDSDLSALDWAAKNGHADALKAILGYGAEVNACGLLGRTALHRVCAGTADHDVIKVLIGRGADTEILSKEGYTPLSEATHRFDYETMLVLLRSGADANKRNSLNNTPLQEACLRRFPGLPTIVDLLLRWGADETVFYSGPDYSWPLDLSGPDEPLNFGCSDEETKRTRRLLIYADEDRAWRRRGWLVILRSREEASKGSRNGAAGDGNGDGELNALGDRGGAEEEEVPTSARAERLRKRKRRSAADDGGEEGGNAARNVVDGFSLVEALLRVPTGPFRAIVSFL